VRRAIGYAFPYKQAAAPNGASFGVTFVPGTSVLLPGTPGRQDYPVLDAQPGHTDPTKARALLRQAGYAPGEYTLSWPYIDDSFGGPRTETIVRALEAAGFDTEPFPTRDGDDHYAVITDPNAPLNLRPGGWCPDWPTGSSWIPPLFHSKGAGYAFFSEPAVDAEIDRITRLPLDQQAAAWGELDKTIMTDHYPVVVTGYDVTNLLRGPGIGGTNIDNKQMPTWKDLHIVN
jgi:peptide/nickel transport system substrate-binding protein